MFVKSLAAVLLVVFLNGHSVESQGLADDIRLRFYFGSNQWQLYSVQNLNTVVSHPSFVASRPTVIYHYGFSQTEDSDNVRDIINAYVTHGNVNFILIYYLSVGTNVITNTRELGGALADSYIRLCDAGVAANRLHLVGFSLGAQVQAFASRNVQSRTNRRIVVGRLTGLDPGQIQSVLIPLIGRLSPSDAAFVDSIHTEGVGFGDHASIGHVSYWVNGGVSQPFCTSGINTIRQTCSHTFAGTAWAESVRARVPIFPALQCSSWENFIATNCNSASVGNMGMHTSSEVRGVHFLRTNNQAPFSRAQATP